jgi:tetratricopeptide (TPR) repeat protein
MLGELQMQVDCCAASKTFSELRDFLESQRNTKAAAEEDDELAHDLSLCYNCLGIIHLQYCNYDIAQTCFSHAFVNQMGRAMRCNTAEAHREAAICAANFGNACMSDNNYEVAKECFETAYTILSEKVPYSSEQQKDIASIYSSRGQARLLQLKPTDPTQIKKQILDDGTQWLQKALDIRRQLVEKTNVPECRRDLALSLFDLGRVYYENGLFDCVFAYYMEGHQLIKEVEEETGFWNDRCLLAFSYIPLAECRLRQKTADLKEAERWCNDCIALSERLLSEQPTDTLSSAAYLTRAYRLMGRICLRKKAGPQSAKKWAKKALAIDEAAANGYNHIIFPVQHIKTPQYPVCG